MTSMRPNKKPDLKKPLGQEEKDRIPSDVLGSYTGLTKDGERPVQDADDL